MPTIQNNAHIGQATQGRAKAKIKDEKYNCQQRQQWSPCIWLPSEHFIICDYLVIDYQLWIWREAFKAGSTESFFSLSVFLFMTRHHHFFFQANFFSLSYPSGREVFFFSV